ncbi:DUF3944 domain-containing protein [Helicobacter rodentium]|uniref:DUF3944 domain-containing protein n=1 Tax=Helicobacter rodentium TaxID=59617 RepID=UPI0004789748|nr:DUF3944 domain-containing protein [Helicobacter rodentium]
MAYDKDLEFLGTMDNEDLDDLVELLVAFSDKMDRIQDFEGTLPSSIVFKQYYPNHKKYLEKIIEEIKVHAVSVFVCKVISAKKEKGHKSFSSYSIAETFDTQSLYQTGLIPGLEDSDSTLSNFYKAMLVCVCEFLRVDYEENSEVESLEELLLRNILQDAMDRMPREEIQEFAKTLGVEIQDKGGKKTHWIESIMQSVIEKGGFAGYKLALIVANTIVEKELEHGLTLVTDEVMDTLHKFSTPINTALDAIFTAHPGEIQKKNISLGGIGLVLNHAGIMEERVLTVRIGVSLVTLLAYLRQDSKTTREDKERVWEQLGEME